MTPPAAKLWDDLLKAALLGTERQRPAAPAADGALGVVLSRVGNEPPDRALLAAAAAVSVYRRAGAIPPADESARPAAGVVNNDVPQVSWRSGQHLQTMLAGTHADVLPEWLLAAGAAGRRVPDVALPRLLDAARGNGDLREPLRTVLGKRGRWLAARNPDWSFAAEGDLFGDVGDADEVWQTGQRAARVSVLARLRHADAARSRSLLESTWAQEPAEDRAKFLVTFRNGLSLSDEPFLEAALDDRSKDVRQVAAGLLARLSASQFVRRMTERAVPLLAWKPGKKPRVEVTLPAALDKGAGRDGVETKSSDPRTGQKQWWLRQILSAVPPATWAKRWGATPAEIVGAVRKSEFETVLLPAWAQAAARNVDAAWAEAVLSTEMATVLEHAGEQVVAELQAALPNARRESLLLEHLSAGGDDDPMLPQLLRAHGGAWSPRLARAVVERVRAMVRRAGRGGSGYWTARTVIREAALRVPPAMFEELSKGWPEDAKDWHAWKGNADEFLAKVQFRRDMLEEVRK
jgi:hypothetical protein